MSLLQGFLGQLLALATFFAFPAFQFLLLRRFARNEGSPQLWRMHDGSYRVVIRNLPGRHTLSQIRYRALARRVVAGAGVAQSPTYLDVLFHDRSDYFLFPGVDQVLLAFRLESLLTPDREIAVVSLDGQERSRLALGSIHVLVCDYEATIENLFNFDFRLAKRVEISLDELRALPDSNAEGVGELQFSLSTVTNVG